MKEYSAGKGYKKAEGPTRITDLFKQHNDSLQSKWADCLRRLPYKSHIKLRILYWLRHRVQSYIDRLERPARLDFYKN